MRPLLFPLLFLTPTQALSLAAQRRPVVTEDVTYHNREIALAALLLLPGGRGPHPAAVIVHGSGRSDRTNGWARMIAEVVVARGFAVLLPDKRGSGASGGDWLTADFHDLADDALAGWAFLRSRSDIDAARIGVIGLSQGGWVAPIAAARSPDVAFVITLGSASVTYAEQSHHEMANTARQAGLSEAAVQEVIALNRLAGDYLLTRAWAPYEAARNRGLASAWSRIAEGYPAAPESAVWDWLRMVGFFDPIPYWKRVRAPALVLYGEDDERDNVPVAESVRRLEATFEAPHPERHIMVIRGVGHSLIDHRTHTFPREFMNALTEWLARR